LVLLGIMLWGSCISGIVKAWNAEPDDEVARESGDDTPEETQERNSLPKHSVEQDVYDTPIVTRVIYTVTMHEEPEPASVKRLLEGYVLKARKHRGFKFHGGRATAYFVYILDKPGRDSKYWVAMAEKTPDSKLKYHYKNPMRSLLDE
ncbi:MAG: hypothetical protein VXB01_14835, partial [Opitutae bacterium]